MEIVFQQPLMLYLLLFIPFIIILHYYFYQHNKKKAMKFSNFSAMKRVTGTNLITKNSSQLALRVIVITLIVLSASRPEIYYEAELLISNYVIAVDTSASMSSHDIFPTRLDMAKKISEELVKRLDAKVAVMSFSGVSYIKQPLTLEKANLMIALSSIDVDPSSGTDIGSALITAVNMLPEGAKSIILLSDGSDTAGIYVDENLQHALNYIKKNNAVANTIAIGSGEIGAAYVDLPAVYDFSTLKKISEDTNGMYFEVKNEDEIEKVFELLDNKTEIVLIPYDLSAVLFFTGFIALLIEWLLLNTRFRTIP